MVSKDAADVCSVDKVRRRVKIWGICGRSGASRVRIGVSCSCSAAGIVLLEADAAPGCGDAGPDG